MANTHHYISYMRQGLGVQAEDTNANSKRKSMGLSLTLDDDNTVEIKKGVSLYGAGDVLGFNHNIVVRTIPKNNIGNFNASWIPYIEFAEPDFLWRYSSKINDKWLPWLSLIILKNKDGNEEGEFEPVPEANTELPSQILILKNEILPDLKNSWQYAHIHTSDKSEAKIDAIQAKIKYKPQQAVCRLIAPRRLKPGVKYTAFVVPTYQLGKEAALGNDLTANRKDLSWNDNSIGTDIRMPYYYKWEFRTGKRGSFKDLVEKLKPKNSDSLGEMGNPIDFSNIGFGLDSGESILTKGALYNNVEEVNSESFREVKNTFSSLLNKRFPSILNSEEDKPTLVPPVYGEWYDKNNATKSDDSEISGTKWVKDLNLDFRYRIAASMGAEFIKENQEELMQSAWKQLEEVQRCNQHLNRKKFGRAISDCCHKRIKGLNDATALQMGMPLHTKIMHEGQSIMGNIEEAGVCESVCNPKIKKYLNRKIAPTLESMRMQLIPVKKEDLLKSTFTPHGWGNWESSVKYENLKDEVITQNLGEKLKEAMNPQKTIEEKTCKEIANIRTWEDRQDTSGFPKDGDELSPIRFTPQFYTPMYRYLRDKHQNWLLPNIDKIEQNVVTALKVNPKFVEAFMVGLNHEFGAELRWREYPTSLKGTYFTKFWDTTIYSLSEEEEATFANEKGDVLVAEVKTKFPNLEEIDISSINAVFDKPYNKLTDEDRAIAQMYEDAVEEWLMTRERDIEDIIDWEKDYSLGGTSNEVNGQINVLIRGDILNKAPNMTIYLAKKIENAPVETKEADKLDYDNPTFPIHEANFPPDIVMLGFSIKEEGKSDYYLVFEEPMTDPYYEVEWNATDGEYKHFSSQGNGAAVAKEITQTARRTAIALSKLI